MRPLPGEHREREEGKFDDVSLETESEEVVFPSYQLSECKKDN